MSTLHERLVRKRLPDLLRERAEATPDALCVESGSSRRSFAELDQRSDLLASGLASLGVGVGDRVAVLMTNRVEAVELLFGCAKLGAIDVPLNAFLKGSFLAYQLRDSGARAIAVDEPGHRAIAQIAADVPELEAAIAVDAAVEPIPDLATIPYGELLTATAAVPDLGLAPSAVMTLLYTSGTTGMPKGCMLSHGYYGHSAALWSELFGMTPADIAFAPTPFFHVTARMNLFVAALVAGAGTVLEPEFVVSTAIERVAATGATLFAGVGAMGLGMLAQPPSPSDRENSLRTVLCAPWTEEQQRQFEARFDCEVWAEVYGQTECQPITIIPRTERDRPRGLRVLGRPAAHLELRVVDDDDREVERGAAGELVLRPRVPEAMFKGYWGKPEATAEAWRNLWHHTGDVVRIGTDGAVEFVDRRKDSIRRRGENVSSVEVEGAILAHPAVYEVAVHGVQSAVGDEEIKACIVVAEGAEIESPELFAYFKESLPYFAVPRYVELLDELPRNALGRVMKQVLRDRGAGEGTWDLVEMGLRIDRSTRR
jgi:crotonobetaine/carnitine-CoA ligase